MGKIYNNISKIYCAAIKFKYYGNQPISGALNFLTLEKSGGMISPSQTRITHALRGSELSPASLLVKEVLWVPSQWFAAFGQGLGSFWVGGQEEAPGHHGCSSPHGKLTFWHPFHE